MKSTFQALKDRSLFVGVTTSHSGPFDTDTPQIAVDLVKYWISEPNIDFLSPTLFSTGTESTPDFEETNFCQSAGCTWKLW